MKFPGCNILSLALILIINSFRIASCQPDSTLINDSSVVQQKDIKDIFNQVFKREFPIDSVRLKSKGPFITFIPAIGYSIHTGFTGSVAASATFYTVDERRKISKIDLDGNYSQFHQYWFDALSNVYIEKRKLHLFGDTRYYKFPTQTYGLGPESLSTNPLNIDYSYLRFYQILFREIASDLFVGMGYNLDYHWNIRSDSIPGSEYDQFIQYQVDEHSVSSGISLNILYDNRKNMVNPQGGTYANLQFRPNLTLLGSDSNWQSLLIEFRHYFKIPGSSRNVLALWSYNDFTLSGNPAYLDMPSIGWDDYSSTGRGYVAGRYTGRNLMYLETEYRFSLTKNGILGGVIFGNAQSYPGTVSSESHTIVPGGGFGLRIKYSKDSNINLALDYGFGINGSHGFFFNMGEFF